MRKMMNKVAGNMKVTAAKTAMLLKDKKGENYVDTAVKILIAVVIGALLLAGLYALFGDVVMPTLTRRIQEMFNYAGYFGFFTYRSCPLPDLPAPAAFHDALPSGESRLLRAAMDYLYPCPATR